MSLEQLQEENAKAEAETESNQNAIGQDAQGEENTNEDADINADESHEDDTEDGSEDGETLESWQQTEEEDTSTNDQNGFVPNAEAAKKRKQNKALRGQVKEQESENELLKKQIEELKAGVYPAVTPTEPVLSKRPDIADFDYDQARFDVANDEWMDQKLEMKIKNMNQSSHQQQQQEQAQVKAQEAQKNSLDDHYARAGKLIESGKVNADNYRNADTNVRRALENINPGAGDNMTDQIIATLNSLGEGSEKVMYQLGVNNSKLFEFTSLMQSDGSGLKAMAYLGKLHTEVQSPSKRRSNAPKPATSINGEATKSASSMQRKYAKTNDVQKRIDMKYAAKKAGEDVSKW